MDGEWTGTVMEFIQRMQPAGWEFPRHWLYWPPDVFALTSLLMGQTGCYRQIPSPDGKRVSTHQRCVETAGETWMTLVSRLLCGDAPPDLDLLEELWKCSCGQDGHDDAPLRDALTTIQELAPIVRMDALRTLARPAERKLAGALIALHGVADEACTGVGLVGSPRRGTAMAHLAANLLLNARGTLSTIPKHYGIVLPKMRTPQTGLTLRSMSHHMTFHVTEVEVMWRLVPWVNIQENSLNLLCVPWPERVRDSDFRPAKDTFEVVRYFTYGPEAESPEERWRRENAAARMREVTELVDRVTREVGRVHVLVFPELALTEHEYHELMEQLRQARMPGNASGIRQVPIIIAGIATRRGEQSLNEVRVAAYFAQRWYDLSQRKHHRWRLDRRQIRQYGLEGRLSTTRAWYEDIPIAQRRLTFLAPTGWLALCPLICEDLAQLEPVASVIRGVGPTLLLALLMDGPQIDARWPARYANVLADDPGTAVLSMTSVGMLEHSRREEDIGNQFTASQIFALWKDQIAGSRTISMPKDHSATLLTVCAEWREEFSADERSDHQNAAVFRFEGTRHFELKDLHSATAPDSRTSGAPAAPAPPAADASAPTPPVASAPQGPAEPAPASDPPQGTEPDLPADPELPADAVEPSPETPDRTPRKWLGQWVDIRELTAATFSLDAAIAVHGKDLDLIKFWLTTEGTPPPHRLPPRLQALQRMVAGAQEDPLAAGIESQSHNWPTEGLRIAAAEIGRWFTPSDSELARPAFFAKLVSDACKFLSDDEATSLPALADDEWLRRRVELSIPIAILAVLHARIERLRRRKPGAHTVPDGGETVNFNEMSELLTKIEAALAPYL